ncbi:phenylalanine--tRNA ligase subunit beta [Gemmatimonas sp.]|uniref:phenylalanine--tRNA ligase subunit beta n=1 Tax=Gemmatimonas sp. TaxID=1962908 RepID=UPI0039835E82
MIVSHEWLKQFVPHTRSAQDIGDALSRHCVTLDNLERLGGELASFVVAQVVEAGRHPNSDHLWVTKVDDGSGLLLDVVCGAPNVVVGTKYPFARTGTLMPGGLKIEKRKIRGETSNGMLCSARELGLGQEHDGILALETDADPGTPLLDVLPLADARLDLDVLPNRPDLLSHLGVAREIAAVLGVPMTAHPADIAPTAVNVPVHSAPSNAAGLHATVRIDDAVSCPRYIAAVITGVQVGPSPDWLRQRLESIGQRSISNVVDATNYVLHGLGQPVHAFDLAKLTGKGIVVRPTIQGESIVTLDGTTRALAIGTTVICDGDRPVALAGVMGGFDSEVTASTTDVLLEVAVFEPRFVRRVRRAVNLSTDASYRFERGVDGGRTLDIARTAATLITQVAGGQVVEFIDVGEPRQSRSVVTVRPSRLGRVLGVVVAPSEIRHRLESLGCTVVEDAHGLVVTPPTWRHDLLLEVDLIEEVARLVGFDSLPDELRPFRPGNAPDHPLHLAGRRVRDLLVGMGLAETRPMPFTSTGEEHTPRVRNPLADDEPFLRASILDTLARRAEYNLTRMQGNLRLFEIGNVFLGTSARLPREEVHVGALIMGSRRPAHFTEPQPPAFDLWDAKEIAGRVLAAAFPGQAATLSAGATPSIWTLAVDGLGHVGRVETVALDRPVWASEAFGLEVTLGVMTSADVAPPRTNGHNAAPFAREASASAGIRFQGLPTTPAVEIDLALLVPDSVDAATVEQALRTAGGELLERVSLFDEFRGAGVPATHRSLGWRLTFRHPERTLRDKEIEGRRARLLDLLDKELGIRPRAT